MAYGIWNKGCLCETCEGCEKQDKENFYGLYKCDNYKKSPLAKIESKYNVEKESKEYSTSTKSFVYKNNKYELVISKEIEDTKQGLRLFQDLSNKGYYVGKIVGDINDDEDFLGYFYCAQKNESYEIKTKNQELKKELRNLYAGA